MCVQSAVCGCFKSNLLQLLPPEVIADLIFSTDSAPKEEKYVYVCALDVFHLGHKVRLNQSSVTFTSACSSNMRHIACTPK